MAHRAIQSVLEGFVMIVSALIYEYRTWRLFHKYDISSPQFTQLCQQYGGDWVAYQRVKEQQQARRDYQINKVVETAAYVVLAAIWFTV